MKELNIIQAVFCTLDGITKVDQSYLITNIIKDFKEKSLLNHTAGVSPHPKEICYFSLLRNLRVDSKDFHRRQNPFPHKDHC